MTDFFFFSSRRRHTRYWRDWSSDVCSSDLSSKVHVAASVPKVPPPVQPPLVTVEPAAVSAPVAAEPPPPLQYGMRLVAGLGNIISVSQTRVVQSMASVGDTLTSLVKKL